jgi:hypothetical protein
MNRRVKEPKRPLPLVGDAFQPATILAEPGVLINSPMRKKRLRKPIYLDALNSRMTPACESEIAMHSGTLKSM